MKKILAINYSLTYGGAEKIFAFVINALAKKYEVHLLLFTRKPITLEIDSKIIVHQFDYDMTFAYRKSSPLKVIKQISSVVKTIRNIYTNEKVDSTLVFDERLSILTYMALKRFNAKIVYSMRNDPYDKRKSVFKVLRYCYRNAYAVVYQLPQVQQFFNLKSDAKEYVIPNPAFVRENSIAVKEYDKPEKYILAAGRFQYRKGFDLLIKAFSIIKKDFPEYKLVICGDGEEKEKLVDLVNTLSLADSVIFPGYVDNVMTSFSDAELFVLPSRSEGIPNILIEAELAGIPCVATDCSPGGARFLLDDGNCGLLAKNDDVEDLSNNIIKLLSDNAMRQKNIVLAEEYIISFAKDSISEKWINVFSDVNKSE